MCNSLVRSDKTVTLDWREASSASKEYWEHFWNDLRASIPPHAERAQALLQGVPPLLIHFKFFLLLALS